MEKIKLVVVTRTTVTALRECVYFGDIHLFGLPQQQQQQFVVDRAHSPGYLINQPIDCQDLPIMEVKERIPRL